MKLRAGDIVRVDFGVPQGSEPGFVRPSIVVTADLLLIAQPRSIHVVPLTSNVTRRMPTEVELDDGGPLGSPSVAQVHLCTVISHSRITGDVLGNIGPAILAQIRTVLGDILDIG